MAQDFYSSHNRFKSMEIVDGGGIVSDNGAFSSDGSGNVNVGTLSENGNVDKVQKLGSGKYIEVGRSVGVIRVSASNAVTGVQLPTSNNRPWQQLTVVHEGEPANTITYGNSVAGGDPQAGHTARRFIWNPTSSIWYAYL